MTARREELRALGPTSDNWEGPGSIRPADLAQCWEVIEVLDKMIMAEREGVMLSSRVQNEMEQLANWCETSVPLFSSLQGTAAEIVQRERARMAARIRNALVTAGLAGEP